MAKVYDKNKFKADGSPASDAVRFRTKRWRERHPERDTLMDQWAKDRWNQANKDKQKVHREVYKAVTRGDLERGRCEVCGAEKVHGHHDDYEKPLEVRWLCPQHHSDLHKESR